jgi:hypothetical protein
MPSAGTRLDVPPGLRADARRDFDFCFLKK